MTHTLPDIEKQPVSKAVKKACNWDKNVEQNYNVVAKK